MFEEGEDGGAIARVGSTLQSALSVVTGRANLPAVYESSVENIRAQNSIPPIESRSVDLYPNYTGVLFAYDLPYRPRPTTQSFTAYTAKLAELNAAHLRDRDAPETILLDISPEEDRLSSSDDGLSWPDLWTLYDMADVTGDFLVLERSDRPRQYSLTPVEQKTVTLGEWTALPDEGDTTAIWMELDARPNLVGSLMGALLRLSPIYMEVELVDRSVERYSLLTDVATAGQLLSPLISDRGNFAYMGSPLWRNTLQYSAVKRFRLVAEGWSQPAYSQSYQLKLSVLNFDRQSVSSVKGWSAFEDLALLKSGRVISEDPRKLAVRIGPSGKSVFLAHADTRVEVPLPGDRALPKNGRLSIGFGILDKAWEEAEKDIAREGGRRGIDGVEFRVLAIYPDGKEDLLFSQWVDPHVNEADKGEKTAEVVLPAGIQKIALETLSGPNQNDSWDWSYWSKFDVE